MGHLECAFTPRAPPCVFWGHAYLFLLSLHWLMMAATIHSITRGIVGVTLGLREIPEGAVPAPRGGQWFHCDFAKVGNLERFSICTPNPRIGAKPVFKFDSRRTWAGKFDKWARDTGSVGRLSEMPGSGVLDCAQAFLVFCSRGIGSKRPVSRRERPRAVGTNDAYLFRIDISKIEHPAVCLAFGFALSLARSVTGARRKSATLYAASSWKKGPYLYPLVAGSHF